MPPKKLRISRSVFKDAEGGARSQSEHFSLVKKASKTGGCAAVVSKKAAKTSVDRHQLKRRVLSVMRPFCTTTTSHIVYARKGAHTLPFSKIKQELLPLLSAKGRVGYNNHD